jgi:hypothetical protein
VTGQWFSPGTPVSINKADRHNITEKLLKVALNTINLTYMTISVHQPEPIVPGDGMLFSPALP